MIGLKCVLSMGGFENDESRYDWDTEENPILMEDEKWL